MRITSHRLAASAALAAALALCSVAPAGALEPVADEKERLKACEKSFCEMVISKSGSGDLACGISKTWTKSKIKEGVEKKKIDWSLGDARCGIDLSLKRDTVVEALTKPTHTVQFTPQTIKCEVEREKEVTPIKITLAPKIDFKEGKAVKAWLGISDIDAPAVIKSAIWTAAKLEDTVGLFHGDMIEEINEFMHKKCPKWYGEKK